MYKLIIYKVNKRDLINHIETLATLQNGPEKHVNYNYKYNKWDPMNHEKLLNAIKRTKQTM